MTIQFNCPNCNEVIGFDDKHAGKQAHCTSCGQKFTIPSKSFEKAKKVKPEKERTEPLPGFYKALFVDTWKIFIDGENKVPLVFVIAVVCFQFVTRNQCCCGPVVFFVGWGWLLGFYLNIIYETSFDIDTLPEIYLGTFVTFFWHVTKPFFLFFITMAVVQLPFILILIFSGLEITSDNFWYGHTFTHLLLQIFFLLGLFLFPIAIITTAVGRDITMFRPDYVLKPVIKAFIPYVVITGFLVIAVISLTKANQYTGNESSKIQFSLALNLLEQVLIIAAMRAIGLFYRHYSCYFSW